MLNGSCDMCKAEGLILYTLKNKNSCKNVQNVYTHTQSVFGKEMISIILIEYIFSQLEKNSIFFDEFQTDQKKILSK